MCQATPGRHLAPPTDPNDYMRTVKTTQACGKQPLGVTCPFHSPPASKCSDNTKKHLCQATPWNWPSTDPMPNMSLSNESTKACAKQHPGVTWPLPLTPCQPEHCQYNKNIGQTTPLGYLAPPTAHLPASAVTIQTNTRAKQSLGIGPPLTQCQTCH